MIPAPESPDAAFEPLVGEKIGGGNSRMVYAVIGRADLVIKVSIDSNKANWTEYLIYKALADQQMEGDVGTVESISSSGKYLIMELLSDLSTPGIPGRPLWCTDPKRSNFGVDKNGHRKVRDYGEVALGRVVTNEVVFAAIGSPDGDPTALRSALDDIGSGAL